MHGHDERTEFLLAEILQLVDQERDGNLTFLGSLRDGNKQVGKVAFEIPAVRRAIFRINIEADFDVAQRHLAQSIYKTLEHGQTAFGFAPPTGCSVQLEQQLTQRGNQQYGKRFVTMRFKHNRAISSPDRKPINFMKQNRLANTSLASKQQALF